MHEAADDTSMSHSLLQGSRDHWRRESRRLIRARSGWWLPGNNVFPTQQASYTCELMGFVAACRGEMGKASQPQLKSSWQLIAAGRGKVGLLLLLLVFKGVIPGRLSIFKWRSHIQEYLSSTDWTSVFVFKEYYRKVGKRRWIWGEVGREKIYS